MEDKDKGFFLGTLDNMLFIYFLMGFGAVILFILYIGYNFIRVVFFNDIIMYDDIFGSHNNNNLYFWIGVIGSTLLISICLFLLYYIISKWIIERKILPISKTLVGIIITIGIILYSAGKVKFEKLETPSYLLEQGENELSNNNLEKALLCFDLYQQLSDYSSESYLMSGIAFYNKSGLINNGQVVTYYSKQTEEFLEEAESDCKMAIYSDSNCTDAYIVLANISSSRKDNNAAIKFVKKAAKLGNIKAQKWLDNNSYVGVGIQIITENNFTIVSNIIPNSPAAKNGRIKIGDIITGIGQGYGGQITNILGWNINDVSAKLRGKQGTVIKILVSRDNFALSDTITILRDRIN